MIEHRIYRIGRGAPATPVSVSFDPADHRRCQNLLTWFERGGEPRATLLIDDWKLCAASDPGLAQSVEWIAATARDVDVIIIAGTPNDVPERLRPLVLLGFLALHDLSGFTKGAAWKGEWWHVPIGIDQEGKPVVVELTHHVDGHYRTGSHLCASTPDTLRSLVLGLMATHSPKLFQAVFIDAHETDTFDGLDQAPHVQAHHRGVARDPALIKQVADALLAESERRLEVVGNTWTVFHHRGFDQVLPQLLICVNGLDDIIAAEPGFAAALATVAEDVGKSGMQLLLDRPHELAPHHVPECSVPADLDDVARSLPQLMHQAEPVPDFFALHGIPGFDRQQVWRIRPLREQYRVAVGTDEHSQPVEIDIKTSSLQDGMGPHGEVVAPAGRRAELIRAMLLSQMLWHSPDDLQLILVDYHGTGVFAGLDSAPHVYGSYRRTEPVDRFVEALAGEQERRTNVLAAGNYRTTWDYRRARYNGAPLDPLPEVLVCIDGVKELVHAHPEFLDVLTAFGRLGRSYGQHLLLSDTASVNDVKVLNSFISYHFELTENGWTRRIGRSVESLVLPPDLDEVAQSLPQAIRQVEPGGDPLLPPPLHEWSAVTLDELGVLPPEHRTVPVGLRDVPFAHRVDVFFAQFGGTGRHGAIVGKPGSGRTTALRTLAESITRTFGSTNGFHLEDGPLYGRPDAQHVVVTASTWAEVPQFIRDSLAWGVELKLADPTWSIVGERQQTNLPDRPGLGLCVHLEQQVRIASS